MSFIIAALTDVGTVKKVNQDSFCVKRAKTCYGDVAFAVLCDGMGGFTNGEVASGSLVRSFSKWFDEEFSAYDLKIINQKNIFSSWSRLLEKANRNISQYGKQNEVKLGTTIVAMLFVNNKYYCINVGDSRAYFLKNNCLKQITKDQTLVQREIDLGNITEQQAENHPQRNILLQCIGCNSNLKSEFYFDSYNEDDLFILCSDGFRHEITSEEITKLCYGRCNQSEFSEALDYLIHLNKTRGETDNITSVIVKIV